ncbi:hypothetical protein [Streptomyces sp. WAC 06725]|uniref:hypothetical protein n=1 Tax=Streptomyces sp. WAC 06725 TaxID=2203209 RepID=UPI00163C26F0|nr:hypothetical protein [Streptomyces sp. WAC 06725]
MSGCGSCRNGQATVEASGGSRAVVMGEGCGGSGMVPGPSDGPGNGAVGGYGPDLG